MPRRSTAIIPALPTRAPGEGAQRWLFSALRGLILSRRLRPAVRLPGSRELANAYGVSRGTVVAAYEQLGAEGYLEGIVGSGTRIARELPDHLFEVPGRRGARVTPAVRGAPRRRLASFARALAPLPALDTGAIRAFRANLPAVDLFPIAVWARLATRRLKRITGGQLLGCDALGELPLRAAIADYLGSARGVRCEARQVVIVSGVQEALELVVRLLIEPGERTVVEDPGYLGAAAVFASMGAKVVGIGVDAEGLRLDRARLNGARLVYVTPAHQYPLGVAMSLKRRLELLDWARSSGATIFEDDYDSEYRYSGRPLPSLQGLDSSGVVVFAGGFNKSLFPALRIGYLVLPPELVEAATAVRSIARRHPPMLDQLVLCDFLVEGQFGRHLRRMREIYAERLSVLVEATRAELGGLVELSPIEAGLQTSARLTRGAVGEPVAKAAARRGIEIVPLSRFARGADVSDRFQLGFAAIRPGAIRRGVAELAKVLAPLTERRRRP